MVEIRKGNLLKASLRKNASADAIIKPIMAKAREKKLNLLSANRTRSTSTILYRKSRLNKTQIIEIFNTR